MHESESCEYAGAGVRYVNNGHIFYPAEYSTPEEPKADCFRLSEGFHNGPECMTCGEVKCEHCCQEFTTEVCARGLKDYV